MGTNEMMRIDFKAQSVAYKHFEAKLETGFLTGEIFISKIVDIGSNRAVFRLKNCRGFLEQEWIFPCSVLL